MSGAPVTRLQLRIQAQAAAVAAANALAAANAVAPQFMQQPPLAAGGPAPPALDAIQMMAQLLQQQALQAKADQAERVAARLESALAAAEALAVQRRAGAGTPPLFRGQARDIAVHTWLIALERWFENAHIETVGADGERIEVATSALRDTAQTWWAAALAADAGAVAAGGMATMNTWAAFTAAIRKHFLPQSPERWAIQQLETLTSSGTKDVGAYSNKFVELDMLIPQNPAGELTRVMNFQRGLPERYRVKCAEKQHNTLAEAMESTLALWNARTVAAAAPRQASTSNAEQETTADRVDEDNGKANRTPTAATDPFQQAMLQQMAALTAAFTVGFSRGGGRGGSRGGGRGGGGRNRQPREGDTQGSESRSRSRTPGVPEEVAQERIKSGLCTNPVKSTN